MKKVKEVNKQTIYIAQKSTNKSRHITAPEPIRGEGFVKQQVSDRVTRQVHVVVMNSSVGLY